MSRLSLPIWLIIIVFAGVCMFHVKFAVQELEAQLALTNRQVQQGEEGLRVLRAEWSYLNEPGRLADLNQRHLGLVPVAASQMIDPDAIPARAAPPADPHAMPPIAGTPGADAPIASAPPAPTVTAAPASAPAPAAIEGPTAEDAAALTNLLSTIEAKP